jgi:hypothetical protein
MEWGLLDRTVFVSLNYDILLDRSLLAVGTRDIDYHVDAFVDRPAVGASLPLLKLHGSLNWRVCDACHVLLDLGHVSSARAAAATLAESVLRGRC